MTHPNKLFRKTPRWLLVPLALAAVIALVASGTLVSALDDAHSYDMTYRGATDTVNGAIIYAFTPTDSTGTGYWHSFLRVSSSPDPIVKGYSSDYKNKDNVQFEEDPAWTESFLLKDVPQVMVEGVLYREFQLDINQNSNGINALISIDELEVWLTDIHMNDQAKLGPINTDIKYPFDDDELAGDMYFVWSLDQYEDNVILINFGLNPGSGKRDFKIQIPDALFDPTMKYVVLYTEHGGDAYTGSYDLDANYNTTDDVVSVTNTAFPNNDGFEEWGVTKYPANKLGSKWNDLNADGNWDMGEPGLENWTIFVDYDGNGLLDAGEPYDVTDVNGSYEITDIEPGTYDVREVLQEGWTCSCPAAGYYLDEEFGNGAYIMGNNFGNYEPRGCLEITKVVDLSSVVGEIPDVNFTITVTGPSYPNGTDLVFNLTGGTVCLCNLTPGNYTANETPPAGWETAVINGSPANV